MQDETNTSLPESKPDTTQIRTNKEKVVIAFFIGATLSACISLIGIELLADKVIEVIVGFVVIVAVLRLLI